MEVTEIYTYPVKSLRGLSVAEAIVLESGLESDRGYCVVQERNGVALTAREVAKMLTIDAAFTLEGRLQLRAQGQEILVPAKGEQTGSLYEVWGDHITGDDMGDEVAAFLSDATGKKVRLIKSETRLGTLTTTPDSFVDLMPLLITTEESLADVNSRLDVPVSQLHFRPNIVIGGLSDAYEEDLWHHIRVGELEIEITMGCNRCIMPNIDPATGAVDKMNAPVTKALLETRRADDKLVYFGQNARVLKAGTLRVGDKVEVLSKRDRQWLSDEGKAFYKK